MSDPVIRALHLHDVALAARRRAAPDAGPSAHRYAEFAEKTLERFGCACSALGDDDAAELARLVGAARAEARRDVR